MGALMRWLNSESEAPPAREAPLGIDELRHRTLAALDGCMRPHDERIRLQLARAATVQELWLLHCEIYQAVARQHCEFEAARRINALSEAFERHLPPGALTRR